jgi:hypothetical protein
MARKRRGGKRGLMISGLCGIISIVAGSAPGAEHSLRLLDAAHMIMDANEQLGQPIVPNGLPLTKIHHAAFDAYLVGIDSALKEPCLGRSPSH